MGTRTMSKRRTPGRPLRQRTLDFLAKTMQADRVELPALIGPVAREFGISKTAARNRVMKAIAHKRPALAQANGVSYLMTIERELPSPPNPIFVIRATASAGIEAAAGGKAASGACSVEICAPADLVPA